MTDFSGLKAAGLAADTAGCGHYRVIQPLAELKRLGAETRVFTADLFYDELEPYDFIIAQRQCSPVIREFLRQARLDGKTVVCEIDDLLSALDRSNPAWKTWKVDGPASKGLARILRDSNGLTVSTPELALGYAKDASSVQVVPNCIDFSNPNWEPREHDRRDEVVVGWAGGTSHMREMDLLGSILERLIRRYPQAIYGHFGHPLMLEYLLANHGIPRERTRLIEPLPFDRYPSGLHAFDVGLAPLENTPFNRAKSPLKAMEYSAAGVPFVASRVAPYQRYCDHGTDGFLAGGLEEWVEAIGCLVEDADLRKRMGRDASIKVRESCSLSKNIHRWVEAWSAIRDGAKSDSYGRPGRNDPCPCGSGKKYKKCACYGSF